ncbi:MAG TPA: hypothetical protein VF420_04570 [Casimicrobiaceae bacterium]
MSARLDELAERKQLLLAQLQLQRMEAALRATELREAIRPASMIGGAITRPAAVIGLIDLVAPLFGLRRFARWARAGTVAVIVYRILREWRSRRQPQELAPESPD